MAWPSSSIWVTLVVGIVLGVLLTVAFAAWVEWHAQREEHVRRRWPDVSPDFARTAAARSPTIKLLEDLDRIIDEDDDTDPGQGGPR